MVFYMLFQVCSHFFIFSISSSSFSSSPSPLHFLHNASLFSHYKLLPPFFLFLTPSDSLIPSNSLIFSFSPILPSPSPVVLKAKKSFYVLSSDVFHLTLWSGALRLVGPSPLTYRPQNHIPMGESISFSFFFSSSSFFLIFGLNVFLAI